LQKVSNDVSNVLSSILMDLRITIDQTESKKVQSSFNKWFTQFTFGFAKVLDSVGVCT
jgi:hypothetical protein